MFFRRTDTATLSTMITTMKSPPITPAAIRGVLKKRHWRRKGKKIHKEQRACNEITEKEECYWVSVKKITHKHKLN